jgi:UDP-glucuronate 4-epimerase
LYNIGNGHPVKSLEFISAIETATGKKAQKQMLPMQPGDVAQTWADTKDLEKDYQYKPNTPIQEGVSKFINWFQEYYSIN